MGKSKYQFLVLHGFIIAFLLLLPFNVRANVYTRSSGTVIITAPKSTRYQWYVKKNSGSWKKIKDENHRSIILMNCTKRMNGYYYKCKLAAGWSKREKLIITDIGKRYQWNISAEEAAGLFMPKCADGYCYVHSTKKALVESVKNTIDILNSKIGRTFIYTDSPHIADIVIQTWSGNKLNDSMWLRQNEIDLIKRNGKIWAGVTFSIDSLHYLICIDNNFIYDEKMARIIIAHELGHCIGIPHSDNKKDLMYSTAQTKFVLTQNDLRLFKKQRKKLKSLQ